MKRACSRAPRPSAETSATIEAGQELTMDLGANTWDQMSEHFGVPDRWMSLNFELEGWIVDSVIIGMEEKPRVKLKVLSATRIN